MKILHVTSVLDGRTNSGTARVAREVISSMHKMENVEMHFLHFDSSSDPIYSLPGTCEILIRPAFGKFGGRFFSFIYYALTQRIRFLLGLSAKFDVVHWHVSRIYPFFFLLPSKKHVLTLHDAGGYLLPNVNTISSRIFLKVIELSQRFLFRIIVVSEAAKRDLIGTGKYLPDKVSVIYNATMIHTLTAQAPKSIPKYVLDSDFILCVSRWQEHKQVERVIECLKELQTTFKCNLNLVLIGKPVGGYQKPLELITKYDLKDFVHIASDLSDEQLKYLYLHAQVNVFPSRHEGFGLSVLEGMACGCPAVVHFGHSTQEILQLGGLAVDTSKPKIMAEAVVSIIEARGDYSRAASNRSKDFDWEITTSKLVQTIYGGED